MDEEKEKTTGKPYRKGLRTKRMLALTSWATYKKTNPAGLERKEYLKQQFPELY